MRKSKSIFSVILAVAIIIGMLFVGESSEVNAAELQFPNLKYEDGVISFDPIPNLVKYYYLSITKPDGTPMPSTAGYSKGPISVKADLKGYAGIPNGVYGFKLFAEDSQGNTYTYQGSYELKLTPLRNVSNVVLDSNGLRWDYDYTGLENADITFDVSVRIDGEYVSHGLKTKETKVALNMVGENGTHDYEIVIDPYSSGDYSRPVSVQNTFKGVTFTNVDTVKNVKVEGERITWDPFPGATRYNVRYIYKIADKSGTYSLNLDSYHNDCPIQSWLLREGDVKEDQMVSIYIKAYQNDKQISGYAQTEYHFVSNKEVNYPVRLEGHLLTSRDDIWHLYNDMLRYDPVNNTLIFNNFEYTKYWGNRKEGYDPFVTCYGQTLTVKGKVHADSKEILFYCDKDLIFEECDITGVTSQSGDAIAADNIIIKDGCKFDVHSNTGAGMYAAKNIVFPKTGSAKISTSSDVEYIPAIFAEQKIDLGGYKILEPSGGKLGMDDRRIENPDGTVAKSILLSGPTPTPSPTPTAKPKPTAKPTAKVTAEPTAKVTSQVTKAPAKPTAKPTAKATPTATVAKPADPKVSILSFVERIYKYVLDREPEAEGAAFWSDELYAFRRTGAEVAQGFIFSPEFEARNTTDTEFVTILYKTFFGRDPEETGMNFWLSQLSSGAMDRVTVANGFIYSQEWADTCASYGIRSGGDLKPSGAIEPTSLTYAFVERMYTTCMGRGYDEEGRQYWASLLANFETTGEIVGASFFLSDEMTSYALSNDEFLNRLYLTFMDREADADGAAYWLGVMSAGTPRADIVFGFTRSPEFTEKCIESRILPY